MISLNPNEKIIKTYRRHWFILLLEIIAFGIPILITIFIALVVFLKNPSYTYRMLTLFICSAVILALLVSFWIGFVDYWLDIWLVTSERVIDIEQKGFFVRDFSEFKISKIQNINVLVAGFIPTILNFGNLTIQTASTNETFVFRNIPDPYKAKNEILSIYDDYLKMHRLQAQSEHQPNHPEHL